MGWFSGTGFDGPVYAVKFDTAINKLYVGGAFNHYNGTPVSTVVRLDLNGTLDSTFLPPS